MIRLRKPIEGSMTALATPFRNATALLLGVAEPGFTGRVSVTVPVYAVLMLPSASSAATATFGEMIAPACAVVGCCVKTRWVAAPAMMLNVELVPSVSEAAVAVSVYPVPALSMESVENVATPAAAAIVVVPESVPAFAFVPIATVTLPVKLVATLSNWSSAVTLTAGVIAEPAAVSEGCTVNESFAAGAGLIVNALETTGVTTPELAARV